jgi:hypothetical protein
MKYRPTINYLGTFSDEERKPTCKPSIQLLGPDSRDSVGIVIFVVPTVDDVPTTSRTVVIIPVF